VQSVRLTPCLAEGYLAAEATTMEMALRTNVARQDADIAAQAERRTSITGALVCLSLTMLSSSLGVSIANVTLPALSEALGAPFREVQWVVLGYLVAVTALVVGAGKLGDVVGRRRLLLAGLSLFAAASVLCGAAPSLRLLILARILQGLGGAVMMALAMAFVGEAVPKRRTGSAMGLLGTTSAIGTALGPSLGGVLIAGLGWRAVFLALVPFAVAALVLAWRFLPRDRQIPDGQAATFDATGTLLLALTLAAWALAVTIGRGSFSGISAMLLLAAVLGAGLFVFVETKQASPLLPLRMFREPALGAGFISSALVTSVVMATLVVGPFYLARALALTPASVGLAMSCGPLVAALTGVPAGRLVDRFGAQRAVVAGLVAMIAGCGTLALLPASLGVPGYVAPLAVITAGYALFQAANNTAVMSSIDSSQRGTVSGLLNMSRNLGLVTGASAMGAVFAFASGASDVATASPQALATGMQHTLAGAALLSATALAIVVRAKAR
jgi:EmrB/QacA subfamily drug resistance transporter